MEKAKNGEKKREKYRTQYQAMSPEEKQAYNHQKQKKKNEEKKKKEKKAAKAQRQKERRAQQLQERREAPPKICTLCEKPHRTKTQLCVSCNRKWKQMKKQNERISIVKLLGIKKDHPGENIWEVIKEGRADPAEPLLYMRPQRMQEKRELRAHHRSEEYHSTYYDKDDTENIPPYVFREMGNYPHRELVGISGKRTDPHVYYTCLRCGEEQATLFSNLTQGHDCPATKSSGEAAVEAYLKRLGIPFRTQRKTLPCINPRTRSVMPYDIEIREKKLLIEVQGNQHYEYTPFFHGSEENFQYQQWKDRYKKKVAEHHGYRLLYIDYPDIHSGRYQQLIQHHLMNPSLK